MKILHNLNLMQHNFENKAWIDWASVIAEQEKSGLSLKNSVITMARFLRNLFTIYSLDAQSESNIKKNVYVHWLAEERVLSFLFISDNNPQLLLLVIQGVFNFNLPFFSLIKSIKVLFLFGNTFVFG